MPSLSDPSIWLRELFIQLGLSYSLSSFLSTVALVLIVMLLSWLSNLMAKAIIQNVVTQNSKKDNLQLG